MQKIFYNASFKTLNENKDIAEAVLTNDESIVFAGQKDEVLQMKNDETELVDLKEKFVMPTLFCFNMRVFDNIEKRIKTAKICKKSSILTQNDENYEKFDRFGLYQKEFLKIQDEFLKNGITTIQELINSKDEFVFWKKIAESGSLKIDVIGYIDFLKNKQIMDDNCRSFRKYKNHFRLGGYHINLDGNILEKKAWLKKTYPKEGKYFGYAEFVDEQLSFVIKTALEEKKQLLVFANGDRALEQFLRCYEENQKENKIEDNYRPMVFGCSFANKKLLLKMKQFDITPVFEIKKFIENEKTLKKYFGTLRVKKLLPLKTCKKIGLKFLLDFGGQKIYGLNDLKLFFELKSLFAKNLNKNFELCQDAFHLFVKLPAYYTFDFEQKGSLESGKHADFIVTNKDFDITAKDINIKVLQVYQNGNLIYKQNKK